MYVNGTIALLAVKKSAVSPIPKTTYFGVIYNYNFLRLFISASKY